MAIDRIEPQAVQSSVESFALILGEMLNALDRTIEERQQRDQQNQIGLG